MLGSERLNTGRMLEGERINTGQLLDQENLNLSAFLKQDQTQFEGTMSTLLATHEQDEKDFAGVVQKEEGLLTKQQELSELFAGRLVPDNRPTPHNACLADGEEPGEGQILTIFGDNSDILRMFPHGVLEVGDTQAIAVDRESNSNAIALSLDFRDAQNRIALRVNKDGVVNRSPLILLRPNKSTFLVEDVFGKEMLRAEYVNPKVFKVTGKAVYCGQLFDVQPQNIHNSCAGAATVSGFKIAAQECPKPQQ